MRLRALGQLPALRTALRDSIITKANADLVLKMLANASNMDADSLVELSEQMSRQAKVDYRMDEVWARLVQKGINMNMDDDDDEEIVVAGVKRTIKCPLSLEPLVQPLTNDGCQHSFSEKAILNLLKDQTSIACPSPGCKSSVSRPTLKRNPELERFVAKELHRQQTEMDTRETFAID